MIISACLLFVASWYSIVLEGCLCRGYTAHVIRVRSQCGGGARCVGPGTSAAATAATVAAVEASTLEGFDPVDTGSTF